MGLGLHGGGVGAARFFALAGADVLVTDIRDEETLAPSLEKLEGLPLTFVLGEHRKKDFAHIDVLFRNPGVAPDSAFVQQAREGGALVLSDAGLFMRDTESFVIGVTGTKGKTTTTMLIAAGMQALGLDIVAVGTPGDGHAFLDALQEQKPVVVAEFSSWDLEGVHDIKRSPQIAVVTNFFADHLTRHKSMARYAEAKSAIGRYQHKEDTIVYRAADAAIAPIVTLSLGKHVAVPLEAMADLPELSIAGTHQRMNAALAYAAIRAALAHPAFPIKKALDPKDALSGLAAMSGLEGRFEIIGEYDGLTYINDTTATNPGAAERALLEVHTPIVLIAGGDGKGLSYTSFAGTIVKRVKHVILLPGSAADALWRELGDRKFTAVTFGSMDMRSAVAVAKKEASSGDTILLSPGASSLNAFTNEFARGSQFKEAIAS